MSMLITDENILKNYYSTKRVWQGIPSIERTKNKRLFASFYSGKTKETMGNYCMLIRSDDDGANWTEPICVAYAGETSRCFDSCLWIDPLGRLWFVWAVMPEFATYAAICDNPDEDVMKWNEPIRIGDGIMMNKPIVTTDNEWLFPLTVWSDRVIKCLGSIFDNPSITDRKAFVYKSLDHGATFEKIGGVDMPERSFDEHMLLELDYGNLMMLVRTDYGIGESFSYDGGHTWTPGQKSQLTGPDTRFFIRRLKSGRVLLVNHYEYSGRNNLAAMISEDNGKTWKSYLYLDQRSNVSYPDAVEGDDGFIYIIYDRERGSYLESVEEVTKCAREVLMAKITEEDILKGELVNPESRLQGIIHKLTEYDGDIEALYTQNLEDYIDSIAKINDSEEIIDKIFTKYGRYCMSFSAEDSKKLDEYIKDFTENPPSEDIYKAKFILRKIISILKVHKNDSDVSTKDFVDRIFKYINENLMEEFSLTEMAAKFGISKFYMCHIFKLETRISIMQYRNKRRLALAKQLLSNTDNSIQQICMDIGFSDASYFSKWFKQEEGISPNTFRNLNKTL